MSWETEKFHFGSSIMWLFSLLIKIQTIHPFIEKVRKSQEISSELITYKWLWKLTTSQSNKLLQPRQKNRQIFIMKERRTREHVYRCAIGAH